MVTAPRGLGEAVCVNLGQVWRCQARENRRGGRGRMVRNDPPPALGRKYAKSVVNFPKIHSAVPNRLT